MSKRPYDDSSRPSQHTTTIDNSHHHNGLLPINDLLSPTDDQHDQQSAGSSKRPRNFIASVACENCRLKKTRCDESRPKCGLCKSLDLDCIYNERKSSKRDQSLSLIMSTLHRLETKMEDLPSTICNDMQPAFRGQMLQALQGLKETTNLPTHGRSSSNSSNKPAISQGDTPDMGPPDDFEFDENPTARNSKGHVTISFSQHGVILWPGAREILPERLLEAHEHLGKNYVISLEMKRPPLPMYICPFPSHAGDGWLESLPLTMVKGLSDAFFATFNPFTPIMDKNFFFAFTLGAAIESSFGYTIESCVVLNVMALGCLAVQTHQEGNYPLPGTRSGGFEPPDWVSVVHEESPGLRFFNEARRRIGFLMCDNDLQSCQFYLLSSVYYSQILRPMDAWAMIHRAATCCLSMLTNHDVNFDGWEGDMKSRVYWNCLMNETILVQELHLPPSGLARLEEFVPIPKFIPFETAGFVSVSLFSLSGDIDDSFFQYHFLAQVAHRIILTRIRHSLYFYSDSGTFPLPAVNAELQHQLEQWRLNLPPALQFSDDALIPPSSTTPASAAPTPAPIPTPTAEIQAVPPSPSLPLSIDNNTSNIDASSSPSPAIAITDAMLRGRYKIAKFHIGRPYLYKALRIPASLSEHDLDQVRSGLQNAMDWPVVGGVLREMKSCVPIKFAFCSQFFGQILLFYCISHSSSPRLRETLPDGWERWNSEMWRFLEDCAPFSPAVAQDLELLRLL